MKILSVQLVGDVIYGYRETTNYYIAFEIDLNSKVIDSFKYNKKKYKDYKHFCGVIGKFNPYTIFLLPKANVEQLNFDVLKEIIKARYKEEK